MKTIEIGELQPDTNMVSFADTAMFLNIMYPKIVDELLEVFTDYTDFDLIAEIVDTLSLNITAVIEPINHGTLIHGYIHKGKVLA